MLLGLKKKDWRKKRDSEAAKGVCFMKKKKSK